VAGSRVVVDWGDERPGEKHFRWEQRGVPFRIEVGPRDADAESVVLKHRVDREKETVGLAGISPAWLRAKMDAAQAKLFERARAFRDANTRRASSYEELKGILAKDGGFVRCWFEPDGAAEERIKEETKATVRCIPLDQPGGKGKCIASGQETGTEVLFAQAY
jgi:prolyl-tRNA synthetase